MTTFEEVSRSLHPCLAFLTGWGYTQLPDEISHSALLGDELVIRYASTLSGREVCICFSPGMAPQAAHFSVFVSSRDGEQLFVNNYLSQRDGVDVSRSLIHAAPEQSIAAFCREAAASLQSEFETGLADLVQGRSWNFPPFDWAPYK